MVYDVRIMAKAEDDLSEIIMETANFLSGMFKRSFLRESTGIRAGVGNIEHCTPAVVSWGFFYRIILMWRSSKTDITIACQPLYTVFPRPF